VFERPLRLSSPQFAAWDIHFTEAIGFFANAHYFHAADGTHWFSPLSLSFPSHRVTTMCARNPQLIPFFGIPLPENPIANGSLPHVRYLW
jgi:hypothetical protein